MKMIINKGGDKLRIEIIRSDKDEIISELWEALNPLNEKPEGKIMVYMTSDGGKEGNKRAMVITINGLSKEEVCLS